jgi:hypothetical protein
MNPPPSLYKEVELIAYNKSGGKYERLKDGEECEIVETNGNYDRLKIGKFFKWFSQGPFIPVIFKSHNNSGVARHGTTANATVIKNGEEITQTYINQIASFYFVVKNGDSVATLSGGRKSRRHKSNKHKRTRRKSLKKQNRRK